MKMGLLFKYIPCILGILRLIHTDLPGGLHPFASYPHVVEVIVAVHLTSLELYGLNHTQLRSNNELHFIRAVEFMSGNG